MLQNKGSIHSLLTTNPISMFVNIWIAALSQSFRIVSVSGDIIEVSSHNDDH
jgi:hypothetical protein